jgi:hypothetical protein
MPSLTRMLQVSRYLGLSVSTVKYPFRLSYRARSGHGSTG